MQRTALILALLVVGLTVLTQWRAAKNEARAEATHPPIGQILTVDGTRIHAYVEGQGPDLVLIHGSSGNLRDFTYQMVAALSDRYRVIVFDRPGLGYSEATSSTGDSLERQADLLVEAAAQLGSTSPIVMGQSLGGAVALAWAVYHPDAISALVTTSAVSHPWDTGLSTYYTVLSSAPGRWIVIPLLTAFVPDAVINSQVDAIFAPATTPEGYTAHFGPRLTLRRDTMRANALQRAGLLQWIQEQVPLYPTISVPTEIVHGLEDETVGHFIHSVPLAEAIPNAVLTPLETSSHMPQHTHMGDVIDAIDRAATRAGLL